MRFPNPWRDTRVTDNSSDPGAVPQVKAAADAGIRAAPPGVPVEHEEFYWGGSRCTDNNGDVVPCPEHGGGGGDSDPDTGGGIGGSFGQPSGGLGGWGR